MKRKKNRGQPAMHLYGPKFNVKTAYVLDTLIDSFQLFDDGRKYYILRNHTY